MLFFIIVYLQNITACFKNLYFSILLRIHYHLFWKAPFSLNNSFRSTPIFHDLCRQYFYATCESKYGAMWGNKFPRKSQMTDPPLDPTIH